MAKQKGGIYLKVFRKNLQEKLKETVKAVLPVIAIVLLLCFTIAPVSPGILMAFLIGAVLLTAGMVFFSLGVDMAMTHMGERVGTCMTQSKKLWVVIPMSFILGFIITISEPDLQVLAEQVPSIPNMVLILSVACGVGVFLVVALLRMLFSIALPPLLIFFYGLIFILTFFVPKDFLTIAFDAGGVTTGPMTVPFIMAMGIGISSIRSDRHASDDSFGLVALCSIGPILAVMLLGMIYRPSGGDYIPVEIPEISDSVELWRYFQHGFPDYLKEMAISLLPIVFFFFLFQIIFKLVPAKGLIKIGVGLVYTYVGLVLFLTGVNVGFMPAGNYLGRVIAGLPYRWIIVPIGMLIGYFIVRAEPAVFVLTKQVEEITDGAISSGAMGLSLSVGVSVSLGLAMIRVLTGISLLWFIVPGYLIALVLSFFVPKIFTAIAFDSGGVASGPMTATFLLPFAMGACLSVGGNIIADAFGVVAMVAMTPLITIQILGLVFQLRARKAESEEAKLAAVPAEEAVWGDYDIIDL
ncbi:DUF1538 domain-containing protein [Eisenbergiella tayi]|uniref:DUF1538 domain-containing protein n=1 Tax=Eisenbergiella tayi TaxID=1432052 RepID=UPI0009C012F0|nr:DUF1538 domain-containing protein [Lachnospiraceae bacterium TF09-5]